MAHFAEIDEKNVVLRVIVVNNTDCGDGEFPGSEPIGQAYIASIGLPGTWKQTSYHGSFRSRYAGPGMIYSTELDEFIEAPQE
jgi:hypothetical protein